MRNPDSCIQAILWYNTQQSPIISRHTVLFDGCCCGSTGGHPLNTLIVFRHAKSDWSQSSIPDFSRPLKRRGSKAAAQTAAKIRNLGIKPDLIISSPAVRALETAGLAADVFDISRDSIVTAAALYQGTLTDYFNAVASAAANMQTICIFGHNPEISDFASILAQQEIYLHTGTAVVFDIGVPWKELETAEQFMILSSGN